MEWPHQGDESPSGAEVCCYADNIKYLGLISDEKFGATIEVHLLTSSQNAMARLYYWRRFGDAAPFGFSWRARVGNDRA